MSDVRSLLGKAVGRRRRGETRGETSAGVGCRLMQRGCRWLSTVLAGGDAGEQMSWVEMQRLEQKSEDTSGQSPRPLVSNHAAKSRF